MKKIFVFFTISIFVMFMFSSCEKKANLPWPDETEYGIPATIVFLGQVTESEALLDWADVNNISFDIKIEMPYGGEIASLKLMGAVRPIGTSDFDYLNQYQIAEFSGPGTYTIDIDDIVSGVDIYNSTADIQHYDMLNIFVNVETVDGKILYAFLPMEEETFGYDPNMRANPDMNFEGLCIFY